MTNGDAPLRVLALDGADHRVIESLLSAGRLPALDALRRRGATIHADTIGGYFEESVWPSVFTGEPLGDHGAQHFVRFDASSHGLILERERADLEPFWMHLPDRGRGVLAVDVPQVHPTAESNADHACGWSGWSAPHRPLYQPRSLRRELGRSDAHRWMHEFDHEPSFADERAFSARCTTAVARRARAVGRAARDRRVVCSGVEELHGVAHLLAHHWLDGHPHRPWPPEPQLVTDVYEATDRALAPLVDDPHTNIVVLASQGFRPANSSSALLPEFLDRAGLAVPSSANDTENGDAQVGRNHRGPLALARRWLPAELRERLAVRVLPTSVQERLMSQRFRVELDWARTRVFALPSWSTGYLRVNLIGREPLGTVRAEDYEALLQEVEALLRGIEVAPGRPLVAAVHHMRREFPGRSAEELPDLAVEWAEDRPMSHASHPRLGSWNADAGFNRFRWSDHHGHAVGFLAGPNIRPNDESVEVPILGASATFLRLLGVRPPTNIAAAWDEVLA